MGSVVGFRVGTAVRAGLGCVLERTLGPPDGLTVGVILGWTVGKTVGCLLGALLGRGVGLTVGLYVLVGPLLLG